MKRLTCIAAIMTLASTLALADIAEPGKTPSRRVPKPKPSPDVMTRMDIRLDRDATVARLIVPKSQLKQLRAELEQLDDESDDTAAVTTPDASRTQTLMSGAFLSLALVFGGIWFVRSGRAATRTGKVMVIGTVIAGIATAATYIYANVGPPPEARKITGKMFSQAMHLYGFGGGEVKLEAGTGDAITLIVPNPKDATSTSE